MLGKLGLMKYQVAENGSLIWTDGTSILTTKIVNFTFINIRIVTDVYNYNKKPPSLFALSVLSVFTVYNKDDLEENMPEVLMNQISELLKIWKTVSRLGNLYGFYILYIMNTNFRILSL